MTEIEFQPIVLIVNKKTFDVMQPRRLLAFEWDDGGRGEAGYTGRTGDCAVRAAAIVTGKPYKDIYQSFRRGPKGQPFKRGTLWPALDQFLTSNGFAFIDRPGYLDANSLPFGRLVVDLCPYRHVVAVVNHVIHDDRPLPLLPIVGFWKKVR